MSIRSELENLIDAKGCITAIAVIKFGRSHPQSFIGKSLTWDDKKAADEYRDLQACALIEADNPLMVRLPYSEKMTRNTRAVAKALRERKPYQPVQP
ncbi:MAG TPA: hypothetical protein VK522_22460 [Pseudolabrys sp.]|nr:hypothetical protein [Pseudolabrys sp.]